MNKKTSSVRKSTKKPPEQRTELPSRETVFALTETIDQAEESFLFEAMTNGQSEFDCVPLSEIEANLSISLPILYRRALRSGTAEQNQAFSILNSVAQVNATVLARVYEKEPALVRTYAATQKTWPMNVSLKNIDNCRVLLDQMKVGTGCLIPTSKGKSSKELWSQYAESIVKSFIRAKAVHHARKGDKWDVTDGYAPIEEFRNIPDTCLEEISHLPFPVRNKRDRTAWWKAAKPAIQNFWNHFPEEYKKAMAKGDEKIVEVIRNRTCSQQSYVLNQIRDTFYSILDRYFLNAGKKEIRSK